MKKTIHILTLFAALLGIVATPIEVVAGNQNSGEAAPTNIITHVAYQTVAVTLANEIRKKCPSVSRKKYVMLRAIGATAVTALVAVALKNRKALYNWWFYGYELYNAAKDGYLELVKSFVEKGANVNAKCDHDNTPMHIATEKGHLKIVKYLVNNGANINAKNDAGDTPIHIAVINGQLEIVKYLLEKKEGDINIKNNDGRTLIHESIRYEHLDIFRYLIEKGADVNAKDTRGNTPLILAATRTIKFVKCLVEKDADITLTDNQGETARNVAHKQHEPEIENYLVLADQVADNNMDVKTFFDTHGFTEQTIKDVFRLAVMTGSYKTIEKLYAFDPLTFSTIINKLTKISGTITPNNSLNWYVQLLAIATQLGSTKLFHNIVKISADIEGLPSVINGAILQREKLEQPNDKELIAGIKELRKAWLIASENKKGFTKTITNLLKTTFALEQKKYTNNTFEGKKIIKTEQEPIPGFIAPMVVSYLGTNDFNKK